MIQHWNGGYNNFVRASRDEKASGRFPSLCFPLLHLYATLDLSRFLIGCKTITSLQIRICIRSQLRSPFGNFVKIVTTEDSNVSLANYLPAKEVEKFIDNNVSSDEENTLPFKSQIIEHENVWDLNELNSDLRLFRDKYILLHFEHSLRCFAFDLLYFTAQSFVPTILKFIDTNERQMHKSSQALAETAFTIFRKDSSFNFRIFLFITFRKEWRKVDFFKRRAENFLTKTEIWKVKGKCRNFGVIDFPKLI